MTGITSLCSSGASGGVLLRCGRLWVHTLPEVHVISAESDMDAWHTERTAWK